MEWALYIIGVILGVSITFVIFYFRFQKFKNRNTDKEEGYLKKFTEEQAQKDADELYASLVKKAKDDLDVYYKSAMEKQNIAINDSYNKAIDNMNKSLKEKEKIALEESLKEQREKHDIEIKKIKNDIEEAHKNLNFSAEQNKKILEQKAKIDEEKIRHDMDVERQNWERAALLIYEQTKEEKQKQIEALQEALQFYKDQALDAKDNSQIVIEQYCSDIDSYKQKQDAINEEIRRRDMKENERDAHRLILPQNSTDDIHFLLSLDDKIHNKELLHKLIWTEYLQKPFNAMINRQFGTNVPKNVIYCVENMETQKKYIGLTKQLISKRWTDHIKTSLGINGTNPSNVHKAMLDNWGKFMFSIVEQNLDENELKDKESFYIAFYQSDIYGYNIKS